MKIPLAIFFKRIATLAAREGYRSSMVEKVSGRDPFRVLVSCILSLRTKDELTEKKSRDLWEHATDPRGMIALGAEKLAAIIYPVGFYRRKGAQIVAISKILLERYGGKVPCELNELLELPGVGRKTANLVLTLGFDRPGICVDTHVHRIANRWGYVKTKTPKQTELALRVKLPRRYWKSINRDLVFFGKRICTPLSPKCSTCPLNTSCPKVGVTTHR